jgi:hypothetical protein
VFAWQTLVSFAVLLEMTGGCTATISHQIRDEHHQLRDIVMAYVDDQIMDNLIRAYHGLPIAHFDFSHVNASASLKLSPQVGGGRTSARVSNKFPNQQTTTTTTTAPTGITSVVTNTVAAIGGAVETITKPFTYSAGAENNGAMSVEIDPVQNAPEIYAAYVRFLNGQPSIVEATSTESVTTRDADGSVTTETSEKQLPPPELNFDNIHSLRRTSTPPPPNAIIGKKWRDGYYYWVPYDHKQQFFQLCLATVMRKEAQGPNKQAKDIESTLRQQFLSQ